MSACSKSKDNLAVQSIKIEIWSQGQALLCNEFSHQQQSWRIKQLSFFLSNIQLASDSDNFSPELLVNPWQTQTLALIQPELLSCDLVETSAAEAMQSHSILSFSSPVNLTKDTQLSFDLGVPFALNHKNPLGQPSPLNVPSMFWSWRSGHKFFRLDSQTKSQDWVFHLGSLGCTAASSMRSPQQECVQPNRLNFQLTKQQDGTKLILYLDRLLSGLSLQDGDSCLFQTHHKSCDLLLSNLSNNNVFVWH
jgi:uncharacterized repeat protein (TIGR04052 family)